MRFSGLVAFGAIAILSACGGSYGTTFDSLATKGTSLFSEHGSKAPTPLADMPTGSATYRGVAAYSTTSSAPSDILADATALSEIEMTADFAAATIDGRAYNFQSIDENIDMQGELNINNGNITGNTFDADINGTITETGYGVSVVGVYDGSIAGDFVGSDAEALVGTGSAVGDFGTFGSLTVNAFFGAER